MSSNEVVIVSAKRTPIGAFLGALVAADRDAAGQRRRSSAALESAGVAAADIEEVIMGCVLPAGLGQAPARQAALGAGDARDACRARPSTRCAARR